MNDLNIKGMPKLSDSADKYSSANHPLLHVVPSESPTTQADVIDEFLFEVEDLELSRDDSTADSIKGYRFRSNVSMLMHADNVAKRFGPQFMNALSASRTPKSSSLSKAFDSMSDEAILATVKSRHIQSPSELLAWSEYLSAQAGDIKSEVDSITNTLEQESNDASVSCAPSEDGSD